MTVLRSASRLLAALVACLAVVLLGTSAAWATHSPAPVPSMAPGQVPVPTGWTCHGTSSDVTNPAATTDTCSVSGWALSSVPAPYPSPATYPAPLPHPTRIAVYVDGSPLPVKDSSRVATTGDGDTLNCPSAGSSPSPESSPATTEPLPSPSSSATPTASAQSCHLTASLDSGQAFGLWLFLGALVTLGVFGLIRREGRGFRVG